MFSPKGVVGIGGSSHDYSAAIAVDGDIVTAIEEERLTRRKYGFAHWFENPVARSVEYCLSSAGINLGDVSHFVASDTIPTSVVRAYEYKSFKLYNHHLCHAAAAATMRPAGARAAILVCDGEGSVTARAADGAPTRRETFSFFLASDDGIELLGRTEGRATHEADADVEGYTENSIGNLYEVVTAAIGFDPLEGGKTMGLAAFGQPRYFEWMRDRVILGDSMDDCFRWDFRPSEFHRWLTAVMDENGGSFSVRADLAASVQRLFEEVLAHCAGLLAPTDHDVLCLSGGCALNPVANSALARGLPAGRQLLVPPFAGDAGLSIGALVLDRLDSASSITFVGPHPAQTLARPGRSYGEAEIARAVATAYPRLSEDPSICAIEDVAEILAKGHVIGFFDGAAEMGPRALGGRSILADPRKVAVRERINRDLKRREPFRPLAPMILASDYNDYFRDHRLAGPHMLTVAEATPLCRKVAPAVVHADGTARVQVVDPRVDPLLASLLETFRAATGVAILLNTSFNRRGEPLVETPQDAIDAFLGMGLDGLYLAGRFYWPEDA